MTNILNYEQWKDLSVEEQKKYRCEPPFFEYELRKEFKDKPKLPAGPLVVVDKEAAIKAMETVISYIAKQGRDEHTEGTAERFIKGWDRDWAEGYDYPIKFTTFSAGTTDQMVVELDIPVVSHCSHHLAPILGVCHIAYLPSDKIVGLSKLNRVVERFARRLQVQERLTDQIADELQELLKPKGVAVQIIAEHMCVSTRGVKHHGARTVTTKLTGSFLEDASTKAEFLQTINTHTRS